MTRTSPKQIAGLVDDLTPVVPLRRRSGVVRSVLALAASACVLVVWQGLRPDFATMLPSPVGLFAAGTALMLALASGWAVADAALPQVGARRDGWVWSLVMAGVLPAGAIVLMALALWRGTPSGLADNGRECLTYGLTAGVLTATILTLWLRRGAPARLGQAGLLTGIAAGSAGIFAVSLHCPLDDLVHIGVWHSLVVIIAGMVGRVVVPPLVRW